MKTDLTQLAEELSKSELGVLVIQHSYDSIKDAISNRVNELINADFSRLVFILYRLDIPEKKLKEALETSSNTPASDTIADMIINRQMQKIESRKKYRQNDNIHEEERW